MHTDSPVSSDLSAALERRKLPAGADLADLLQRDRLDRQMTWPAYAEFLKMTQSTVQKIARRVTTKPHDTTVALILRTIERHPVQL